MYEKPRVNVKVEPRSTFTFTSDLPYIVFNLFTHVKPVKVYVRTHVKITRQWKSTLKEFCCSNVSICCSNVSMFYHNCC